ncbi:DUF2795 domain-containing protein [Nonomuraea dietziae]|uniref:DUF2795 domain-containing protein n=1 Tax=Nonomuraea dietziae TaxID=65515 RepID=UPI003408C791
MTTAPRTDSGATLGRSELSRWISGTHVFPADRDTLLERARSQSAPDGVLAASRSLPDRLGQHEGRRRTARTLRRGAARPGAARPCSSTLATWRTCGASRSVRSAPYC